MNTEQELGMLCKITKLKMVGFFYSSYTANAVTKMRLFMNLFLYFQKISEFTKPTPVWW